MFYLRGAVANVLNILVLSSTRERFDCANLHELKLGFQAFLRFSE